MHEILKVALNLPLQRLFDYLPPENEHDLTLQNGLRVRVPFGSGTKVGIIMGRDNHSEIPLNKLKRITGVIDEEPSCSERDLAFIDWVSRYYHHPIGEVLESALGFQSVWDQRTSTEKMLILREKQDSDRPASLRNAPKQLELLTRIQAQPRVALAELDSSQRQAAKALVQKGLIQVIEQKTPKTQVSTQPSRPHHSLNSDQSVAITAILKALQTFRVFLLQGVTGSGKTEIYMHAAREILSRGRQVLILIPEINLTPQTLSRFEQFLGQPIAAFHSALTQAARCKSRVGFRTGETSILIGTRSAALLPARNLGMIILDEEHDASFKQQEGFRFSARDISVMRGRMENIPVVMGSATPSLESLHNAALNRYELIHLPKRAGQAEPPLFQVVDIRSQYLEQGLSSQLKHAIAETLSRKEQSLLFVNRRGFAPTLICNGCGWVAGCRHCDARMVIHQASRRLICHHCGYEQKFSETCPSCRTTGLTPLGQGTERIETTLKQLFPDAQIARIDRDTTQRKGALDAHLADIRSGDTDILVGTQMLAKGHHFPNVTLVGILDADAGLFSLDFRAEERTAQLITQVAGRCGRGNKRGRVILQTRHPDHLLIQLLTRQGYGAFAAKNLEDRRACGLPPYSFQALWRADSKSPTIAQEMLARVAENLQIRTIEQLQILGPAPSPMEKRNGRYRWQLLLQSPERKTLHEAVVHMTHFLNQYPSKPRDFRYSVDIDPIELI